jgi:hypothetical protein
MEKIPTIAVIVLILSALGYAQIPTSGNIFLGYSYSRTNSIGGTTGLNGWEGSLDGKFLPWIGLVADFSAGYGNDNSVLPILCPVGGCPFRGTSVRRYTYLFGPRVSVPVGKFTPFAHFLLGAAHVNDRGATDTSFSTAVGGGLDYKLIKGVAWRLQIDNIHTNFFGAGENHLRFSTGLDLRF